MTDADIETLKDMAKRDYMRLVNLQRAAREVIADLRAIEFAIRRTTGEFKLPSLDRLEEELRQ